MPLFYIRDVEQTKEQIDMLTQEELFSVNIHHMRKSLFKYYPNSTKKVGGVDRNFSIEALKNNTVYLASPSEFDDPYDCNIYIDGKAFALQRIRYYSSLCGICIQQEWEYEDIARRLATYIYQHLSLGRKVHTLFRLDENNSLVRAYQENFLLCLEYELSKQNANSQSYYKAFQQVIDEEYRSIQESANRFRISCFAQTPYSLLMWSHYARYHQGFCIEYETPELNDINEPIYRNLFPVIYTDTRTDLLSIGINWKSTGTLTNNELWDFYKYGLLSKSLDWKYQQEWRLVSCDNLITDKNYNCTFFKIKKVYLGNKMPAKDRVEIIDICKKKGIPYTGVIIAPDRFKMNNCDILCENCDKMML